MKKLSKVFVLYVGKINGKPLDKGRVKFYVVEAEGADFDLREKALEEFNKLNLGSDYKLMDFDYYGSDVYMKEEK